MAITEIDGTRLLAVAYNTVVQVFRQGKRLVPFILAHLADNMAVSGTLKTGEVVWENEDSFTPDGSDAGLVTSMHFVSHPLGRLVVTHVQAGITCVTLWSSTGFAHQLNVRYWDAQRHYERHEHRPMLVTLSSSRALSTDSMTQSGFMLYREPKHIRNAGHPQGVAQNGIPYIRS